LSFPFPLLNASLNGTAGVLLLAGYAAIRGGRRQGHARLMIAALLVSSAFLASYLTYHFVVVPRTGPTRFHGIGWTRPAYFAMLASHVVLAAAVVPLALRTVFLARSGRFEAHKRWARVTFPIWLYVSVTGVLVYLVLYVWNPPAT
jgi:putative membrane protein